MRANYGLQSRPYINNKIKRLPLNMIKEFLPDFCWQTPLEVAIFLECIYEDLNPISIEIALIRAYRAGLVERKYASEYWCIEHKEKRHRTLYKMKPRPISRRGSGTARLLHWLRDYGPSEIGTNCADCV